MAKKIVVTKPTGYLRPKKPCPACEGEGKTDTEPITWVDQNTGERVTMVLKETCKLCKGSKVLGKEARA